MPKTQQVRVSTNSHKKNWLPISIFPFPLLKNPKNLKEDTISQFCLELLMLDNSTMGQRIKYFTIDFYGLHIKSEQGLQISPMWAKFLQGFLDLDEFCVHCWSCHLNILYTIGPQDMRIFDFLYVLICISSRKMNPGI